MSTFETIDIHAHFYPESYLKLIEAEGAEFGVSCSYDDPDGPVIDANGVKTPPLSRRYFDLEDRVAAMDEMGVGVHCLPLTQPMLYWASPDLSERLAVAYNDACAEVHEAYPERFLGLAILPMQEPELALKELERAKSLPGVLYSDGRGRTRPHSDARLPRRTVWPLGNGPRHTTRSHGCMRP